MIVVCRTSGSSSGGDRQDVPKDRSQAVDGRSVVDKHTASGCSLTMCVCDERE